MAPGNDVQFTVALRDYTSAQLKTIEKRFGIFASRVKTAGNQIAVQSKKNEVRFQGWALSILFFGMAIQQAFTSIWKSSTKTFNEIMHSMEGTVTQFDLLNGSLTYLGFVAGQALEPIAAFLIPIVDWIADLISENQEWFRWIVIIGGALGGLMFLTGFLALGLGGVVTAVQNLNTVFTAGNTIAKAYGTTLGSVLAGVAIIGGIILVVAWIKNMSDALGGAREMGLSVVRALFRMAVLSISLLVGATAEIKNTLFIIWNAIVTGIEGYAQTVVDVINFLITWMNKIPGVNIPMIPKVDFSAAKAEVMKFGDAFKQAQTEVLDAYFNWEGNSALTPEKGYANFGGLIPSYAATEEAVAGSTGAATPAAGGDTTINNVGQITVEGTGLSVDEIMAEFERRTARG